jgi:hypothetical protein
VTAHATRRLPSPLPPRMRARRGRRADRRRSDRELSGAQRSATAAERSRHDRACRRGRRFGAAAVLQRAASRSRRCAGSAPRPRRAAAARSRLGSRRSIAHHEHAPDEARVGCPRRRRDVRGEYHHRRRDVSRRSRSLGRRLSREDRRRRIVRGARPRCRPPTMCGAAGRASVGRSGGETTPAAEEAVGCPARSRALC